ncbi:MAG: hypothetical protein UHD05_06965, partial [Ruminococcus sp.]|nr:hypothetical protein [Ruminococcus sp.]
GVKRAQELGSYKASRVIARPHNEILPYLHLDKKAKKPNSETAATYVGPVKEEKKAPAKKTTATTAKRKSTAKKTENK